MPVSVIRITAGTIRGITVQDGVGVLTDGIIHGIPGTALGTVPGIRPGVIPGTVPGMIRAIIPGIIATGVRVITVNTPTIREGMQVSAQGAVTGSHLRRVMIPVTGGVQLHVHTAVRTIRILHLRLVLPQAEADPIRT